MDKRRILSFWKLDDPVWIDNGSHDGFDFLKAGTLELLVNSSYPIGVGVRVDLVNVAAEI